MRLKTKFQDEDFELGEVVDGVIVECLGKHDKEIRVIATAAKGGQHTFSYDSIKKFTDDWEDVPEEEVWYLGEEIGNYTLPKEDARKIAKKILAWKRLKAKGFEFRWIDMQTGQIKYSFFLKKGQKVTRGDEDDLLAIFGGEE